MTRPTCCPHCGGHCTGKLNLHTAGDTEHAAIWVFGSCPVCAYAAAMEDLYRRRVVGSIYGPTAAATAEGVGLALDILTNHPGDDR